MKNLFSLDLQKNPVKQSKIRRTYDKLNKSSSIVYNINNNKIGMNEFKYIVSVMNDKIIINQEESVAISKEIDKVALSILTEGEKGIIIVNTDKDFDFLQVEKKYDCQIGIIDLTESLVDKTKKVKIVYKAEIIKEISERFSGSYRTYEIYATGYFDYTPYGKGYSLELAMHVQKELKWNNAELELFRKEAKVFAGDVVPSAASMTEIMKNISNYLGVLINEGELKFLKEKIESLYLNTEGRFPNIKDLVFEIEQSHIKNKEAIINKLNTWSESIIQDKESVLPKVEEETLADNVPDFIKLFRKKINEFIIKNEEKNILYESNFIISTSYWNLASFVEGGTKMLYDELKTISQNKKFKVFCCGLSKAGIPEMYIYYNLTEKLKELDFDVFEKVIK